MKLTSPFIALITGLGLVSLLSSCQTSGGGVGSDAVTCDKCKTVWVKQATSNPSGKGFITYRDAKAMQCPDCQSAVTTFFKTGEFKHTCSHCGGKLNHCTQH